MTRTVLVVGATGTVGNAVVDALVGGRAGWPAADGGGETDVDEATGADGAAPGADVAGTAAAAGADVARPVPPVPALDGVDVRVRAAVRDPDATATPADEALAFDYTRPETWGAAFDGVDAAFVLYPPGGVPLDRVRDAIDAATRVGVERFALLSVLNAGDVPVVPHRRLERHLAGGDAAWTALRAAYFYQNLAEVHAPDVRERDAVFVPAGDAATAMVDARDVGAAAAVVLTADEPGGAGAGTGGNTDAGAEADAGAGAGAGRGTTDEPTGNPRPHDGRAYELTDAAHTYRAVAAALREATGRPIRYADPSLVAFLRSMRRRGVPTGLLAFMTAEYGVAKYGLVPVERTSDDLRGLLDRAPTDLHAFARDYRDVWVA